MVWFLHHILLIFWDSSYFLLLVKCNACLRHVRWIRFTKFFFIAQLWPRLWRSSIFFFLFFLKLVVKPNLLRKIFHSTFILQKFPDKLLLFLYNLNRRFFYLVLLTKTILGYLRYLKKCPLSRNFRETFVIFNSWLMNKICKILSTIKC